MRKTYVLIAGLVLLGLAVEGNQDPDLWSLLFCISAIGNVVLSLIAEGMGKEVRALRERVAALLERVR